MRALRLYAGPAAMARIAREGLQSADIGTIAGAAGGPKGLILGPLDRFLFGQWLPQSDQAVDLVGASIGAWRMATACLDESVARFEQLEHDYIHQDYALSPGQARPTPEMVSETFGRNLHAFYGPRAAQVLSHPRYRLHVVTARGRHLLGREHRLRTPLGYLGAFLTNSVHRKAMGAWLERVVFSSPDADGACAALPFGVGDYRTRQVPLNAANFMSALQASCSIPFVLQAVHDIAGAPRGAYWDGGITDYHMHLRYGVEDNIAINSIAVCAYLSGATGQKHHKNLPGHRATGAGLVLYPHFQHRVVPGWLDKRLPWRHKTTPALDSMVLLSPNPEWVKTLPNAKLPDRNDFTHYGTDTTARARAWLAATRASQQLADEWGEWLHRPDLGAVQPL